MKRHRQCKYKGVGDLGSGRGLKQLARVFTTGIYPEVQHILGTWRAVKERPRETGSSKETADKILCLILGEEGERCGWPAKKNTRRTEATKKNGEMEKGIITFTFEIMF